MAVNPVDKTVRWLIKTYSDDDIQQIQYGVDAAPSNANVTVDGIKAYATKCDPRGSTVTLAPPPSPGTENPPGSSSALKAAKAKLFLDVVLTIVGLGGAAARLYSRMGSITEALRADNLWNHILEDADQSRFSAMFENFEHVDAGQKFSMVMEFIRTFTIENARKFLAVVFEHLTLSDKIFFGAVAAVELIAFFTTSGAVASGIAALEFVVMADIIYDDIVAIRALEPKSTAARD